MRERIKVTDLTTLFVCPSDNFGTLERRAIADSVFFRDIGGNSIIFCLKDSYIDHEAKLQDIPTIYYTGKKVNKFFDLSYLLDMRKILIENRFDIIHCYNLNYVWNICFLLMANPKVPLFLTFNSFIEKAYKNIIQKWLFRRIDHVITFCRATREIAQEYLPVSSRKIKIAGGGVEVGKKTEELEGSTRAIGAFIHKGGKYYQKIETILYTITPLLKAVEDLSLNLEFRFYCEKDWNELKRFPDIQEKIEELGVGDRVFFDTVHKRELAIQKLDIFVGTDFDEPFNDLEVMALLYFIPVVIPRTASRQGLLLDSKFIGESYHRFDARELKDKLLKILVNEQVYLTEIQEYHEKLSNLHGMDAYSERIMGFYERNFAKRLRVSKKLEQQPEKSN
jgi:glycosyltransferase involved in cell wall biosynthesis